MLREGRTITSIVAMLWLATSPIGAAQSGDRKGDTYQWSGELVAVDSTASTLTLKSRIRGEAVQARGEGVDRLVRDS
jgi:hypothetical protein